MSALRQIGEDTELWNSTLNGLAILSSPNRCVVYKLHVTVEPLAIVSDSFHIKPLIKAYQSIDQYLLLGLNSNEFDNFSRQSKWYCEASVRTPEFPVTLKRY